MSDRTARVFRPSAETLACENQNSQYKLIYLLDLYDSMNTREKTMASNF